MRAKDTRPPYLRVPLLVRQEILLVDGVQLVADGCRLVPIHRAAHGAPFSAQLKKVHRS
jgi:hypothetical protein